MTAIRTTVRDAQARAERVRILYRSPIPAIANLAVAALLSVVAWEHVPPPALAGWLLAMTLATGVRVAVWRAGTAAAFNDRDALRWERRMALSVTVAGLVWATSGLAVAGLRLPIHLEGVLAISVGGMLAGAIFSLTASTLTFRLYVVPAALGPIGGFLAVGDLQHLSVAAMGVVYLLVVLLWGRDASRAIDNGIRLRLENQALVTDLAAAHQELEAAERLKRESFANLGHELRTPLNAIIGFAQALEAELWGPLGSPRYRGYASAIADSGQHLYLLIQGILDMSRHDAGVLELDEESVDLTDVARACSAMLMGSAKAGGVTLTVDVPGAGLWVRGDTTKLRQIVINLAANAIRFTPVGGSVEVRVRRLDDGETEIRVRDTGIGLAAEDIPRALEPFVQVSRDHTRESGGAGLGLPLSKRLAELHGGRLEIESHPGVGTTVSVTLPATRALNASQAPAAGAEDQAPRR